MKKMAFKIRTSFLVFPVANSCKAHILADLDLSLIILSASGNMTSQRKMSLSELFVINYNNPQDDGHTVGLEQRLLHANFAHIAY